MSVILQPAQASATQAGSVAAQPDTYVWVPRQLMEDIRNAPAAIGVYALLARLFLVSGEPVPLSTGDLEKFDPSLSEGAARRSLDRLVDNHYAQIAEKSGPKNFYQPSWGLIAGSPRLWDRNVAQLGRPRHVNVIRLDDRLLDICIGRLHPHPVHPALVDRYVTTPLLGMRAIGAYAMSFISRPGRHTESLNALGLLDTAGQPRPLPDTTSILAVASQRALDRGGLTPAGWRYVGLPQPTPGGETGQALFFMPASHAGAVIGQVPDQVIDPMIGHLIGCSDADNARNSASESAEKPVGLQTTGSHGINGINGINGTNRINASTTTATSVASATESICGGSEHNIEHRSTPTSAVIDAQTHPTESPTPLADKTTASSKPRRQRGKTAADPETAAGKPVANGASSQRHTKQVAASVAETTTTVENAAPVEPAIDAESLRLLRGLGVRSDVARQLAKRPAAQVARVIAQARAKPGVRNLAAWVVSALRTLPDDKELTPAPPKVAATEILFHPDISGNERMIWMKRFRSADPADRPAILAHFRAEHPRSETPPATGAEGATIEPVVEPAPLPPLPEKVTGRDILFHPGISGHERMIWMKHFRAAKEADRPAVLALFHAEHPMPADPPAAAAEQVTPELVPLEAHTPAVPNATRVEEAPLPPADPPALEALLMSGASRSRQPAVSPEEILRHPDIDHNERVVWLVRFHTSHPAGQHDILARFRAEHPYPADGPTLTVHLAHVAEESARLSAELVLPPDASICDIWMHPELNAAERKLWVTRYQAASRADRPTVLAQFHARFPRVTTQLAEQPDAGASSGVGTPCDSGT